MSPPTLTRLAALCLLALAGFSGTADAKKPNILFIGVDDLRPELNCYGATHIHSPNIDRLAREGVLFERAYCQWAVCMPSRASMLSGLRPDTFRGKANAFRTIVPNVVTLPQHFKNHGYFTQSIGKIYHGSWKHTYVRDSFQDPPSWSVERWASGSQYYFSPEGMKIAREFFLTANPKSVFLGDAVRDPNDPDQWKHFFVRGPVTEAPDVPDDLPADGATANAALERLRKLHADGDDAPFFLAVGFHKPHLPFVAPKKYWDLYDPEKLPPVAVSEPPEGAPDFAMRRGPAELNQYLDKYPGGVVSPQKTRHLRHGYAACVSYVDAQIGRLLDELDAQGIREQTIVILWSDHGYKLGDLGSWAKHTNFELDTRVPLIVSAPGLPKNQRSQAVVELVDLHPTLSELAGLPVHPGAEGESFAKNVREPAAPGQDAAFSQFPKGRFMGYTVRTATHRYTEWRDPKNKKRVSFRELYQYGEDGVERVNLAGKAEHAEVEQSLQARLAAQIGQTADPPVSAIQERPASVGSGENGLQAGAAAVNIDPPKTPVIRNGGFRPRFASKVAQSLHARSLVLENGGERVAICVVDSCVMDRELCDLAKSIASEQTGIPADRILVSATHTHSAPSVMRSLGCPADPNYTQFLPPKIAESIAKANAALRPAEAGWTVADASRFTFNRRWIYLPHKMRSDPFGGVSVRAHMHPGHQNPDTAGPSGPVDPGLTLLSIRERGGGKPLAVLGNLSQHYFAKGELSSGYTGRFCEQLEEAFGAPFVGIMSQGTSGDLQHRDYSSRASEQPFAGEEDRYAAYCRALADLALSALETIDHRADCELAMAEAKLTVGRRLPDRKRIAWAREILDAMGEREQPTSSQEIYAKEVEFIRENPSEQLKLQAIRVGDFGIATLPNEVYAITGLKLKLQSPLPVLMNVSQANGGAGYIPPPEQHQLGGYTTWPARTAGLETQAEPQIVEVLLGLLEGVSGKKRRAHVEKTGAAGERILAQNPAAWWKMGAHSGNVIPDASGNESNATLEPGYALFLPGPSGPDNRAVHFAGGRMTASVPGTNQGQDYSVSLWFWNAMPREIRPVTGYLFALGRDKDKSSGDQLGITGKALGPGGRLLVYNGNGQKTTAVGKTELKRHHWHHVWLVRQGENVRVYLDGAAEPEIDAQIPDTRPDKATQVFVGGRGDGMFDFEGKIDEVAVFRSPPHHLPNPGFP